MEICCFVINVKTATHRRDTMKRKIEALRMKSNQNIIFDWLENKSSLNEEDSSPNRQSCRGG